MKMKLVLFTLALAVIAACSGQAPSAEETTSVEQAATGAACTLPPGAYNFQDNNNHSISAVVVTSRCPNRYPVGATAGGTASTAGCTSLKRGGNCVDTCPKLENGQGGEYTQSNYAYQYGPLNVWTWSWTEYGYFDSLGEPCFYTWNETVLN